VIENTSLLTVTDHAEILQIYHPANPTSSCTIDVSYLLAQQITGYIYSFAYSMMGKMYHGVECASSLGR